MTDRFCFVYQKDVNDCGLASLEMIAHYYNLPFALKVKIKGKGISLSDMCKYASSIGLDADVGKVSFGNVHKINMPAILLFYQMHYVVIYQLDYHHAVIADPMLGYRFYDIDTFMQNWLIPGSDYGIVLELRPQV